MSSARSIAVSDIPVIDIGPLRSGGGALTVAQEIDRAAREVGFFYIANHGVPGEVIRAAQEAARAFFQQSPEAKLEVQVNANHHGFLKIGEATMPGQGQADLKESFVWGLDLPDDHPLVGPANPFLGQNRWPAAQPGLRASLYPLFGACLKLGGTMMRAFALSLGLPEAAFLGSFEAPIARGAAIYYPPPAAREETPFGVSPHTDYGCLTLLYQDQVGGLEVLGRDGEWVTAHPIEDTFVVNVGDLLARWSNDGLRSTPHRVVNRAGRARYSLAVAWDPDFDCLIDPAAFCRPGETPKYPPVTCGDYVLSRFDQAFAYRKKAGPSSTAAPS